MVAPRDLSSYVDTDVGVCFLPQYIMQLYNSINTSIEVCNGWRGLHHLYTFVEDSTEKNTFLGLQKGFRRISCKNDN